MEPTDKDAILAIRSGYIDRYAHIVHTYTPVIRSVVARKLFQKHDIDDIVQLTFIKLYKAIPRLRLDVPLLPYLYEIAKNELKMYYRRTTQSTVSLGERDVKVHEEMYTDSKEWLKGLSDEQQKALIMVADGYSYEDIAAALERPLNTIRTIIRRARLAVMKHYHEKA